MGWVAFQFRGHEAFIPAGARCVTRKRSGPGIPYYDDAPPALRRRSPVSNTAIRRARADSRRRPSARRSDALAPADPRPGADRGAVFDRFEQLVNLPAEVTREAVVRQEPRMLDLCWNALELENTEWWRGWERNWTGR